MDLSDTPKHARQRIGESLYVQALAYWGLQRGTYSLTASSISSILAQWTRDGSFVVFLFCDLNHVYFRRFTVRNDVNDSAVVLSSFRGMHETGTFY